MIEWASFQCVTQWVLPVTRLVVKPSGTGVFAALVANDAIVHFAFDVALRKTSIGEIEPVTMPIAVFGPDNCRPQRSVGYFNFYKLMIVKGFWKLEGDPILCRFASRVVFRHQPLFKQGEKRMEESSECIVVY